jgi:hypothetical protein
LIGDLVFIFPLIGLAHFLSMYMNSSSGDTTASSSSSSSSSYYSALLPSARAVSASELAAKATKAAEEREGILKRKIALEKLQREWQESIIKKQKLAMYQPQQQHSQPPPQQQQHQQPQQHHQNHHLDMSPFPHDHEGSSSWDFFDSPGLPVRMHPRSSFLFIVIFVVTLVLFPLSAFFLTTV